MTNEEALCRLADNQSDLQALEALYTHNRTVIDAAIQKCFGRNPVVAEATRYVLQRIAAKTNTFTGRQTLEAFVAELADEESVGLHEQIQKKVAELRSSGRLCSQKKTEQKSGNP